MKELLIKNHGVRFYDKRPLQIPKIPESRIGVIFLPGDQNKATRAIHVITDYLNGEPVGDRWGKNHEGRKAWRNEMLLEYRQSFQKLYYDHNQFRGNKLSTARQGIAVLAIYAKKVGNNQLAEQLAHVEKELRAKVTGIDPDSNKNVGKKYDDMEDDEEKLDVVHFFEDKIIEVLQNLIS